MLPQENHFPGSSLHHIWPSANGHTRRCRMGDVVDKYIRLVDKCQPKVFAEARIYVARFPEEAGDLFKQIKKVRKQIRKTRGGDDDRQD